MVVDIKKLIAAINPGLYCDDSYDEEGKKLSDVVKEIAKKEGYLKAAEKAKLRDSPYLDMIDLRLTKSPFALVGLKASIEQHTVIYDVFSQNLEPIYFWILDYCNEEYGDVEKLIDNFISSPGSGHFAEMSRRATVLHDEAMKIFGTINTVIRSILNLIYDLKEFKLRLAEYERYHSGDPQLKESALLALKQIWMDAVDIKRQNTALKGLAQQFDYVTIIDAFMVVNSLEDVDKLDLNDRVKRILKQRVPDFLRWIKESEIELKKRYEIERTYLKSQFNSVQLYSRWLKPYLKAAQELEQNGTPSAALVSQFNTAVFELTLMAKAKYDASADVETQDLPRFFTKLKLRKYTPITIIELNYRSAPDRGDQRGGYAYRGRVEATFTSFALNSDELEILKKELGKDDFETVYKMISGATNESLDQIKEDLDDLLEDKKSEKKDEKKEEDTNPFSALFSVFKTEKKKKDKDLSKGIPKDSEYEKILRSQSILLARHKCRELYDDFKKAHDMPAFPPTL